MNRRGSLDLSLGEIIKLILGAAVILLMFYIGYQLVQVFVSGEEHYRAERNFKLITDKIEQTREQSLAYPDNSVIIHFPENYMIMGFDKGNHQLLLKDDGVSDWLAEQVGGEADSWNVEKPSSCNAACICLVRFGEFQNGQPNIDFLNCESLDVETIAGVQDSADFDLTGPDDPELGLRPKPSRNLFDLVLHTYNGPMNLQVEYNGNLLVLRPATPADTTPTLSERILP